jgi:hypothetical protein
MDAQPCRDMKARPAIFVYVGQIDRAFPGLSGFQGVQVKAGLSVPEVIRFDDQESKGSVASILMK